MNNLIDIAIPSDITKTETTTVIFAIFWLLNYIKIIDPSTRHYYTKTYKGNQKWCLYDLHVLILQLKINHYLLIESKRLQSDCYLFDQTPWHRSVDLPNQRSSIVYREFHLIYYLLRLTSMAVVIMLINPGCMLFLPTH